MDVPTTDESWTIVVQPFHHDAEEVCRLLSMAGRCVSYERALSLRSHAFNVDLFVLVFTGQTASREIVERIHNARSIGYEGPILVVSAVASPYVEADCFHAGADDFVLFPGNTWVLLARVHRLVRRHLRRAPMEIQPASSPPARVELRERDCAVTIDGKLARLTQTQFRVLEYVFMRSGQWVRGSELQSDAIKVPATHQDDPSNVRFHVHGIRARLSDVDSSYGRFLHSERRLGYMWDIGTCGRAHCTNPA